jgi:hypothetical protein
MSDLHLLAALYVEAVLPAFALLAPHDAPLANALAGPDFAVSFVGPDRLCGCLAVNGNVVSTRREPQSGDIRLWFPTANQLVRALDGRGRPALALPLGGFFRIHRVRRLTTAGQRLETLLNTRTEAHLTLHAWANLYVGLCAAAVWLRHHSDGPHTRARLGTGTAVFACPEFPATLWLDLATLTAGIGEPTQSPTVRVELAELDNRLDAPAALGLGTLRISGYLPLAENLGLIMLKAGKLLKEGARS